MLIITGISDEIRNELSIYAILCRNVIIFHRQELASLFSSRIIAWLHLAVSTEMNFCIFEAMLIC